MAQNDKTKGVWLIKTDEGQVIPENTELNALRTAVSTGGKLEFVKYGDALGSPSPDAPAPKAEKAKPAPKPEPAQTNTEGAELSGSGPDF